MRDYRPVVATPPLIALARAVRERETANLMTSQGLTEAEAKGRWRLIHKRLVKNRAKKRFNASIRRKLRAGIHATD